MSHQDSRAKCAQRMHRVLAHINLHIDHPCGTAVILRKPRPAPR
jgi:hypothetical protein